LFNKDGKNHLLSHFPMMTPQYYDHAWDEWWMLNPDLVRNLHDLPIEHKKIGFSSLESSKIPVILKTLPHLLHVLKFNWLHSNFITAFIYYADGYVWKVPCSLHLPACAWYNGHRIFCDTKVHCTISMVKWTWELYVMRLIMTIVSEYRGLLRKYHCS